MISRQLPVTFSHNIRRNNIYCSNLHFVSCYWPPLKPRIYDNVHRTPVWHSSMHKKHSKISWRFWCYEIMVFRKIKSQSKQTSPPYIFIVMLNSLISPQTSTVGSYHWLVCCSTCRHPLKSNNYVLTVVRSSSLTKHRTTDLSMWQLSHSGQSGYDYHWPSNISCWSLLC